MRETEHGFTSGATPPKPALATVDAWPHPPGRGKWIEDWRPEDPQFWESTGKKVARRNLLFSIFSEHIGFSIWSLWSVLVLFLPEPVFRIDPAGKFLLTTLPTALGAFVRLPYTFAALGAGVVWIASQVESLPLFVVGFVLLFVFSGIGNGSTYKMIPAIFRSQAQQSVAAGGDSRAADRRALRMSGR